MNPDIITKLTAGLFDGIKNMKSAKNYMKVTKIYTTVFMPE